MFSGKSSTNHAGGDAQREESWRKQEGATSYEEHPHKKDHLLEAEAPLEGDRAPAQNTGVLSEVRSTDVA